MNCFLSRSLLVVSVVCLGCDRVPKSVRPLQPVGIPDDADVRVVAPTLGELQTLASYVDVEIPDADDADKPAWAFCEDGVCAVRRARPASEKALSDGVWTIPDGSGSLVVWGIETEEALDEKLTDWRAAKPPATDTLSGSVDPDLLLQKWQPRTTRSAELVERVMHLTGPMSFRVERSANHADVTLRLTEVPGEPRFVSSLGEARTELPTTSSLVDDDVLGIVRVSADPKRLWKLMRSVLPPDQRGALDDFVERLKTEAALDLKSLVVDDSLGHLLVVAYDFEPDGAESARDWLSLRGTQEAILIPLRDRERVRRALDAWTQLSKGRLQVQDATSERLQWAWLEDGELVWTAILGEDYLLVVDSAAALDHALRWISTPRPLTEALEKRRVDRLLGGRTRSGVYLDVDALRERFGDGIDELFPGMKAVTIVAREEDGEEVVDVRVVSGDKRR